MRPTAPRENTVSRIAHPDPMRVPGSHDRILIEDPLATPLQQGYPTLGWEGDPRLALYVNLPHRKYELWRLNADGRYSIVCRRGVDGVGVVDLVPQLIMLLVSIDGRRGYDAGAALDAADDALDRAAAKAQAAFNEEFADRLGHAFRADGVA